MNVLVLSNMYPSVESKTYGIFVKNQVEALKQRGVNVEVIAITDLKKGKGATVEKYARFYFQQLKLLFSRRHIDVIHVHYVFPTGLLAPLLKWRFKAKLIVTAHGGDIDRMIHTHPLIKCYTGKILKQAASVIAVGEELKTTMLHLFHLPEEKVHVQSMGINRKLFRPMNKVKVRENVGISPDRSVVLYVGNMIKEKGIEELLQAAKDEKDWELYLIGENKTPAFFDPLKERFIDENPHIHYIGAVDQHMLPYWFNSADVFILPSYMEGLGLVAVEAMSTQTPVVASDVGGLHYLLKDGAGVLIEPKSVEAIQSGITQVLTTNPKDWIDCGLKQAALHDDVKIIDQLLRYYQQESRLKQ